MKLLTLSCVAGFSMVFSQAQASRATGYQETVCVSTAGHPSFRFVGPYDLSDAYHLGRAISSREGGTLTVLSVDVLEEKADSSACKPFRGGEGWKSASKIFNAEIDDLSLGKMSVRCEYKLWAQYACDEG